MTSVIIIGAGQAGGRAALALRAGGFDGNVTLIGAERLPPYERPPLSKAVLTGARSVAEGFLATPADYADENINLLLNKEVEDIDKYSKNIILRDGESLSFDKLILATGSHPRPLPLPGVDLPGVFYLRTADDAAAIAKALTGPTSVAIIGGGFIGLELAASLRSLGHAVTVLEARDRLLARSLPEEAAQAVTDLHGANGVDLRTGVVLERITGMDRVEGILLADGESLAADLVIVGIGIRPATGLAERAGLAVENGIRTNGFCQTSDPDIYAIGDCACCDLARYGRAIRLESYQNADQQAAVAAGHILGRAEAYNPVPWLWSEHYGHILQTVGFPADGDQTVIRDMGEGKARLYFTRDEGRLVAAAGFGPGASAAKDIRVCQMMIEAGISPSADRLADPAVPLKKLLKGG